MAVFFGFVVDFLVFAIDIQRSATPLFQIQWCNPISAVRRLKTLFIGTGLPLQQRSSHRWEILCEKTICSFRRCRTDGIIRKTRKYCQRHKLYSISVYTLQFRLGLKTNTIKFCFQSHGR